MKLFAAFLFSLVSIVSFSAQAQAGDNFYCIQEEASGLTTLTTKYESYQGRLRVTSGENIDSQNPVFDLDRAYIPSQYQNIMVITVPGVGTDRLVIRIDIASQGRIPGGKQWGAASRVHQGSIQEGTNVPLEINCEVIQ